MEPVIELIAEKIRERLELTADSQSSIRPLRINDDAAGDYKITLTQGGQNENVDLSCQGNPPALAFDQVFIISGELRPSEESQISIDTYRNRFAADITLALTSESNWHNWGGLAIDTRLGTVAFRQTAEASWLEMRILVRYRVNENDPYQVR